MQLRTLPLLTVAALPSLALAQTPMTTPPNPGSPPQESKPVDWKDLTRNGIPIKFYGFFRFDTYYNTARMDSVTIPFRVQPERGPGAVKPNDDQFDMDPRLTRFGIDVTPTQVGDAKVSGKLEIDFANFPAASATSGVAESRATPRIRLAYMDVSKDELGLRVGQDWDIIAPLLPSVDQETLLWNAGNLGDRRPQIQGRWVQKDESKSGHFEAKVALGLTGAINNQDLDPSSPTGERDGFDSGMPHVQARAGWRPNGEKACEIGVWGLYGQIQTDTPFPVNSGHTRFDTWCAGADVTVPLTKELSVKGEAWTGENLGDVRGGIGQTINTANGKTIGSIGGWTELIWKPTDECQVHVGGSIDDPKNGDLAVGNPTRNWTAYAGTVKHWSNLFHTGLDVIYWETDYQSPGMLGNTLRFDLWFQFDF